MLKEYEVSFEFIVKNERFNNGKRVFIRTVRVHSKTFEDAVKKSYDQIIRYLETFHSGYQITCYGVEVV